VTPCLKQLRRAGDGRDVAYLETVRRDWALVGQTLMALAEKRARR